MVEEAVDDPLQGLGRAGEVRQDGENGERAVRKMREKGEVFELGWDKLIVAVGCYSQTFGTPGVREHAYFLKDVGDAKKIRNRLLSCFELASLPTTSEAMKRMLLNFAVVGGGPTGIEWSAELNDIIEEDMGKLYPELVGYAKVSYPSSPFGGALVSLRTSADPPAPPDHGLRRGAQSPQHVRREAQQLCNEALQPTRHRHPDLAPRARAANRRALAHHRRGHGAKPCQLLYAQAEGERRGRRGNVRLVDGPDDEPVRGEALTGQSGAAREDTRDPD